MYRFYYMMTDRALCNKFSLLSLMHTVVRIRTRYFQSDRLDSFSIFPFLIICRNYSIIRYITIKYVMMQRVITIQTNTMRKSLHNYESITQDIHSIFKSSQISYMYPHCLHYFLQKTLCGENIIFSNIRFELAT